MAGPWVVLTAGELEVLRLVARGRADREVSQELGLGVRAVRAHLEQIQAKLHATDRTQAAIIATELGLLSAPHARN